MLRPTSPRNRQGVPPRRLNVGRIVILSLIGATSLAPLVFVDYGQPSVPLFIFWALAKIGSLVGGVLLVWQFILGFRGALSRLFKDLSWVVDVHKTLGQYGIPLILLHPVFITIHYLVAFDINLLALDLSTFRSQFVLIGIVLLAVIAFIVVTSAIIRPRMGFYQWLYTHLSAYAVPPLLFIHSLSLGSTLSASPVLRAFWWSLAGLLALLGAYRIAHKLGLFAHRLRVSSRDPVAEDVTQVTMTPRGAGLEPAYGQFVYVREGVFHNAHPYTVSHFDQGTGELGVTPKALGPQSRRMQEVSISRRFLVDGPYGVFTRRAIASGMPLVMVAGGIGITPFRRVWQKLERERSREAYLFYGNEFIREIAYKDELDRLEHVKVVHVLNQEPDFPGEQGFVTVDVLRKHTSQDLAAYQFLLCGPPVMVKKLEDGLTEANIPDNQIHHELFSH